jgi:hypothetical protein
MRSVWLVGEYEETHDVAFSTEGLARLYVEHRVRQSIADGNYGRVSQDVPLIWRDGLVGFAHTSFGVAYEWLAASLQPRVVDLDPEPVRISP